MYAQEKWSCVPFGVQMNIIATRPSFTFILVGNEVMWYIIHLHIQLRNKVTWFIVHSAIQVGIKVSSLPNVDISFKFPIEPRIYWKSSNKHSIIHSIQGQKQGGEIDLTATRTVRR